MSFARRARETESSPPLHLIRDNEGIASTCPIIYPSMGDTHAAAFCGILWTWTREWFFLIIALSLRDVDDNILARARAREMRFFLKKKRNKK